MLDDVAAVGAGDDAGGAEGWDLANRRGSRRPARRSRRRPSRPWRRSRRGSHDHPYHRCRPVRSPPGALLVRVKEGFGYLSLLRLCIRDCFGVKYY